MIPLRNAFGKYLVEIAENRKDFFVLDADVAGGTCTHWFRERYPERFVECGIAEQNMFGVAAGLSTVGIIPIVTTYGVFASMRAIEQARNAIAYPSFNVKIVASHPGIDVGPDGATHQAVEDLGIYRTIPNFVVLSPADEIELKKCVDFMLDYKGPVYMRTGRSPVPDVHASGYDFALGLPDVLRKGKEIAVFTTGITTHRALPIVEEYNTWLVNVPTLKPINGKAFGKILQQVKIAITIEDHNVYNGLGSAVADVIAEQVIGVRLVKLGIKDDFGKSGDPLELAEMYGIGPEAIEGVVRKCLKE
ncbi:MAG: transketolase family protein [Synergistetes bacterium]|nr:transketolase family protein [Synergistota bacterium]